MPRAAEPRSWRFNTPKGFTYTDNRTRWYSETGSLNISRIKTNVRVDGVNCASAPSSLYLTVPYSSIRDFPVAISLIIVPKVESHLECKTLFN